MQYHTLGLTSSRIAQPAITHSQMRPDSHPSASSTFSVNSGLTVRCFSVNGYRMPVIMQICPMVSGLSGMPMCARYRELRRLCGTIRAEKAVYPRSVYCTLCVLPVKWKLLPVIDAMAWKMAFHGLVNINDKKK